MFSKLLKYDMKAIGRIGWLLCIGAIVLSLIGGVCFRLGIGLFETDFYSNTLGVASEVSIYGLGVMSIFGISIAVAVLGIMLYYRFYSHLYTDEGYLTFTLPVKRSTIFTEKIALYMIWEAIILVTTLICLANYLIIDIDPSVLAEFFSLVGEAIVALGIGWFIIYVLLGLMILAAAVYFGCNLGYFCITLGAIVAKKLKLLAAIGIYYGVTAIVSVVLETFWLHFVSTTVMGALSYIEEMSVFGMKTAIALLLVAIFAAMVAVAQCIYSATLNKIENKLNLP